MLTQEIYQESPGQIILRTIDEEKAWLESEGLRIKACILFGSMQHGNIKENGLSDVDLYFVTEDEEWPDKVGGSPVLPEERQGYHFSVESPPFPKEVGVSHLKYHVASPKRVLDSLNRVRGILKETRPLDTPVEYESEGTVKKSTIEGMLREQTWVYQVFKTGQVISGEISPEILQKVAETDEVLEKHRQRVIAEKRGAR